MAAADFYISPVSEIEPGDIFLDVPFPWFTFPLRVYRINRKQRDTANILTKGQFKELRPGDSAGGGVEYKTVMLVSHGCEVESVQRQQTQERRPWLAAPIDDLGRCVEQMQQRTRDGIQPNKFYLPASNWSIGREAFVDFRKITPITASYFERAAAEGKRIHSLSEDAKYALQSHLSVFFTGRLLYRQAIPCPHCGAEVDPAAAVIDSSDEEDVD